MRCYGYNRLSQALPGQKVKMTMMKTMMAMTTILKEGVSEVAACERVGRAETERVALPTALLARQMTKGGREGGRV